MFEEIRGRGTHFEQEVDNLKEVQMELARAHNLLKVTVDRAREMNVDVITGDGYRSQRLQSGSLTVSAKQ
jgi:hypothetical protein